MVQRKVAAKLGLQADHLKTENLSQHQDVKNNKGAYLKKKMKKSGSVKRPKQPGKTPPPALQRQLPVTKSATTPNYMKSTTSSDARKEQSQSQVSTGNPSTSPHGSSLRRKNFDNSKISSSSGKKVTKTLARTLTKNPSFKPVRASARKCSPVVLCENLDAQRATCASTLKDCKFPTYLSLNPGGTESEGTSTIKVCPYTYCSLNGHHHAPLPPLKRFLSSRRCMIKTQRSLKLGCLSPRRAKPVGDDRLTEENKDFFIEIYSKEERDLLPVVDGEDQEERVLEAILDAPSCNDFDTYEALDQNKDVELTDMGNTFLSGQDQQVKVDEVVSPALLVREESKAGFLGELPVESTPNVRFYELDSEASDMDWETVYHSVPHLDYDYEHSPATDIEPDPETGIDENCNTDGFVIKSDSKDWCSDEFLVDVASQESFDEQGLDSDAYSSSDGGESTGLSDHLQSLNTTKSWAPVEVLVEEAESAHDEENHILFETPFDNLKHESLPNEDATATIVDHESNLENSDENITTFNIIGTEKGPHLEGAQLKSTEAEHRVSQKPQAENVAKPETEENALARGTAKFKKPIQDSELGTFNPRAPNFLPLEPDPGAEKVDLRHQDLDERKNAEEWMVDYALREVVTKLGPARKRKVALLVEAFEKVMPVTKCDLHLRHASAFDQARPIQACS